MEFELSEDQRMMAASLERLLAQHYGFHRRRAYGETAEGWSRDLWRRYAELGLLALPFAEEHGGLDGTAVETMIAMEAFGRALIREPFLPTVILGGGLLRHGTNDALRRHYVPRIAAGELTLALAHQERQARYDLSDIATTARRDGASWVLDGEKSIVFNGAAADRVIVSARTGGDRRAQDGIALFLVDPQTRGVSRHGYATQDGLRAAEIRLDGVVVGPDAALGEPGNDFPLLRRVADEAVAALCAEAVGAMDALHTLTVDYLKQRRQFGRPLGDFQVLQHRAVDMLIMLEQARSMAYFATMMAGEDDAVARGKAVSAAKVQIGRAARFIGEQAVQLHGGIGMTMEYKGGHYFKRLAMIDVTFGDADHHLRQLARGLFEARDG
jgi:pimeloyl-CoA dehydrogenase small subunit